MMKAFWFYDCDFGHSWMIFRDLNVPEQAGDELCPEGHEAVTLSRKQMLDMVQISIRPAARIVDDRSGRISHEYEYFLVITDLHNNVERMSRQTYWWDQIKGILDRFRTRPDMPGTVPPNRAWEIMDELDAEEQEG